MGMTSLISKIVPASALAPLCSFSSLELGLRLLNLLHLLFVLSPPWSWDLDFCYASARCVCSDRWEDKYICIYKYKWYIKYINISGGFQGRLVVSSSWGVVVSKCSSSSLFFLLPGAGTDILFVAQQMVIEASHMLAGAILNECIHTTCCSSCYLAAQNCM